MRLKHITKITLAIVCYLLVGNPAKADIEQQRTAFLTAESQLLARQDSTPPELPAILTEYPLYPYLQYLWLKEHLQENDKILNYLSSYQGYRYANLLRGKWLSYLASLELWQDFILNYQAFDNITLECQYYWANYQTGQHQLALTAAKRLWLVGSSQPHECELLFSALMASTSDPQALIWQRFELALRADNEAVADYLKRLMDKPNQTKADVWLKVHRKPSLIETDFSVGQDQQTAALFAHGIEKMAKTDLYRALVIWDKKLSQQLLDKALVGQIERQFAMALAYRKDKTAYSRFSPLDLTSDDTKEWRLRAALNEQNWQHVNDAFTGLTEHQQQLPEWQYWQARALEKMGDTAAAQTIFQKVANDRSYYGFLAADSVNEPYQLTNKPVELADNALEIMATTPEISAVKEWRSLGRDIEARRQWWYSVGKMDKNQIKIAAKLAQQWQWDQVAIFTLAKADYWDDLSLRFPMYYTNTIQQQAGLQNLDPAFVLGLIRQESIFDSNAQSSAGAKGLMQIMPKTGQQIARQLADNGHSAASLFDPDTNIRYGTYYYKQLLERFNGHFALATAAYNAGPGRVKQWLPEDALMPADVWVATIPFKETRKYVSAVLSYAVIYQNRLKTNAIKIKNLMLDIQPK
ncbi:MAG: transglycosylase SLT domain-containing protein [Methylococcaceae bacterium]|jgi:soluble lytic murein transglycosylase